jgi:hypothetical protein
LAAGKKVCAGRLRNAASGAEIEAGRFDGNVLRPTDLDLRNRAGGETVAHNLDVLERPPIERALAATGGNWSRAAKLPSSASGD